VYRRFLPTAGLLLAVILAAFAAGEDPNPAAPQSAPATTQPAQPADNSYCLTCHMNFNEEVLTSAHQKVGIGCASCHGESDKHSSDENGITPPDIMFPKPGIYAACARCHEVEKLKRSSDHTVMFEPRPHQQACTECHGKHVMNVRTRRWDKVTRKLISDDGVRMVQDPPPKK